MADNNLNNATSLPGNVDYASIAAALDVSNVAYDAYSDGTMVEFGSTGAVSTAYSALTGAGWTQIIIQPTIQDVDTEHYQGVAFYKTVNGVTTVIIANRGAQSGDNGYDFTPSDFDIARGAPVPANNDARLL